MMMIILLLADAAAVISQHNAHHIMMLTKCNTSTTNEHRPAYLRKNKDCSFFSHNVLKVPLSVLLTASTRHNDAAQLAAVLLNRQFASQHFSSISMQTTGLPVSSVTLAASCDMTIISPSSGVNDIAFTRPVSCSTGVHTGGAAATFPTCTVYTITYVNVHRLCLFHLISYYNIMKYAAFSGFHCFLLPV